MDDLKVEFSDTKDLKKGSSFIDSLARYYSDFLATDFKKGRLPKRRFQTMDSKGRRAGIRLEKFPSFSKIINKVFSKEFKNNSTIKIKQGSHLTRLPAVVHAAIEAEIKNINFEKLNFRNDKSAKKYKLAIVKKEADLESENENFIMDLRGNVSGEISADLLSKLEPVFKKSATNLIESLIAVDESLSHLITFKIEETLPSVVHKLISGQDDGSLKEVLDESFDEKRIRGLLEDYFSAFSAGDLAKEIRELHNVEQLDDNLEFYLYFGDARYKDNSFPLFYMPFKIEYESSEVILSFEPRILINKMAIDYLAQSLQESTGTKGASPIENRIIYIDPSHKVFEEVDNILEPIIRAFQLDGDLSFMKKKDQLKNSEVTLVNSLNFALFDKSDESMLTDYEELLQKLEKQGDGLLSFINEFVDRFLTENPETIKDEILNDWDDTDISNRLVFDTPIPLAEEQRKILSALNHSTGRFVTVEGPPGTGKSHTISAITFGAILKGQSVLVLSDKKEALDVVENKLNETLSKVRPSDDFVNPILRLGRVGTNFKKILSNKSIDSLRTQHREIKNSQSQRKERYDFAVKDLKNRINEKSDQAEKIDTKEIFEHEKAVSNFITEYKEYENLKEIFGTAVSKYNIEISDIETLLELRDSCIKLDPKIIDFAKNFGEGIEDLKGPLEFIILVKDLANKTKIFDDAPDIDSTKLEKLRAKIEEVRSSKGLFGYFFSGSKINLIKESISQLTGYNSFESHGDLIIRELKDLLDRANKFYNELGDIYDDREDLVSFAQSIGGDPVSFSLSIQEDAKGIAYIISNLKRLQKTLDSDNLLFLDDDATILEVLTDPDNEDAIFYEYFIDLMEAKKKIEEKFELTDYNYAGRKHEIENYNALELATQIDKRVINFADNYKNDVKTLATIISQKKKFPKDKFNILKQAFPCMICSLRDYAEYIPLERELFDIIIIDEASQVSIAQAFPAIIRAKKMIILGDRKQFGNVKTSNASKELNNAYFKRVKSSLEADQGVIEADLEVRAEKLNISNSILDFMENLSNFDIMLKKHFRGYPEMISFSSKYFYGGSLQAMKVRGKPVDQILSFVELKHDGKFDKYKNTNEQEALKILDMVLKQLEDNDFRSIAIITPFTEQQTLISQIFSNHEKYDEFIKKLKFRSFTFDSCQGEERDIIYYSFVANPGKDRLWAVLPKTMDAQDEEELDSNKKLQRMNVAFSRGKEKLIFVHSKPISSFSAGKEVLNHYKAELARAKVPPTSADVDSNSEAEKRVLEWIKQSSVYAMHQPEIQAQFEISKYLAMLDPNYRHPKYRVDFLLRFDINGIQRDIIIEYDGFEFHFDNRSEVDAGNWRQYLTAKDVEREHTLASYGYPTIRLNKFNTREDPVQTISDLIEEVLNNFEDPGDALTREVIANTAAAHKGLQDGTYKHCKKCDKNKPIIDFEKLGTVSGYGRYCNDCLKPILRTARLKKKPKAKSGHKKCPNCKNVFPNNEFIDSTTTSGKRRLCSSCKKISVAKQQRAAAQWRRSRY
jgi:superfamily I DNA and/or RNA helicase